MSERPITERLSGHSLPDLTSLRPFVEARLTGRLPAIADKERRDPGGGKPWDEPANRRAAVVILLFEHRGTTSFLMIKRAARHSNPGQWALPGGMVDAGETLVEAALRELHEETGVHASKSDVLGVLDDFTTLRGIVITPVVAAVTGAVTFRRNPAEVASIHPIRLSRLLDPGVPRWRPDASGEPFLQMPLRHDMIVHAPTGAILWQFAEIALRGESVHIAKLAQPAFTAN
ncbi:NUDIX hydrolase [Pseudarthrobacter sp. H2]|uniref:NUDIX hydrolase n=1 Tax=Pseudarthrobacter sp. H2 TaxID=3418415 RepID=UPI003CF12AB4